MAVPISVYLNAQAQTQLAQLKAANAIPLSRIDARVQAANTQQTAVQALRSETSELRETLASLQGADPAKREDAIRAFVAQYNELTTAFKSRTAKGGTLATATDVRMAQGGLRGPFQSIEALLALRAAGVETTREGLKVTGAPGAEFDAEAITQAFESTLSMLERRLGSVSQRLENTVTRLGNDRERLESIVSRANSRTEKSFMKMYQVMQAMQAAGGGGTAGGGLSIFG